MGPTMPDLAGLPKEYWDLKEVFSKEKAQVLLPYREFDCTINLLPGQAPKTPSQTPCPDNRHLRCLIPPRNPLFPLLGSWPLSVGSQRLPSARPSDRSLILEAAPWQAICACSCVATSAAVGTCLAIYGPLRGD
ncbi:hypothetical protein SRHO_G00050940 [Serrasalmus rhombeus]